MTSVEQLAEDVVTRTRKHLSSGRASLARLMGSVVEVRSEGPWVIDADGRRYLDFGGYGVFILGHCHPAVVAAVQHQVATHPLATRTLLEPVIAEAAEALAAIAPPGLDHVHFVNSGTEATEAALKLARAHGHHRLITTVNGFHGKTLGSLSVTAKDTYQEPFQPLLPDVLAVPFGDAAAMEAAVAERGAQGCVIVEPIQGEGGVVIPPPGYLTAVARSCARHGAFLIIDEIQTGLGRLGSWWGVDDEGVVPDVLLVGKGLSGGIIPVAAMLVGEDRYGPFNRDPFLHSSTFGGSPLAGAAALAAVRAMSDEDIPRRAARLGEALISGVRARVAAHGGGLIHEVRGRGLLIGIEMAQQRHLGELALALIDRGVLVSHSLNASRVIRLTPPAILTEAQMAQFFHVFDDGLASLAAIA